MENSLEKQRKRPAISQLKKLRLFDGLSNEEFKILQNQSHLVDVETEYIVQLLKPDVNGCENETAPHSNYVYVIVEGIVSIFLEMSLAKDCKYLGAWRSDNQILGEMGNRSEGIFPANKVEIKTITDSSLLEMRYDDFSELIDCYPVISKNLNKLLVEKIEDHCRMMEILQASSGVPRAAFVINYLKNALGTKQTSNGLQINGIISHNVIGSLIGTKRGAAQNSFGKLKSEGIIDYPENSRSTQYTITNLQKLDSVLEEEAVRLKKEAKRNGNRGF